MESPKRGRNGASAVYSMSRFPAVLALLLAVATPVAHAGNADAPGTLKKQTPGGDTQSPAPAATVPIPATPAIPNVTKKPAPAAQAPAKAQGSPPVTNGTVKKLTSTNAPSTTATSGASAPAQARTVKHVRGATRASATTTTARRGSAGGSAHRRAAAGAAGPAFRSELATPSSAASWPLAAQSAPGPAAANRTRRVSSRPAADAKPSASSGLGSITRAADRVVEVIPGAVVLALAGLGALVLLLIVRSWGMERRRSNALEESYAVTVEALATAIEAKDHTTGGHIERVRNLGLLLAAEIAPRDVSDPQMAYGFLLHDIGKLAVPDAILCAPGRLSEKEWALMRRHPEEGVRMLSEIPFLDCALDVVRHHHERWDGGGYPDGLRGHEIPLWARIFSVVDALDAITAERPYRPARSFESALEEIRSHAGTQFDPAVVEALRCLDPARIEPLLEPGQQLDRAPEAALAEPVALGPLLPA
jgi:HD-GYP domain-containing protein (c-di-GMP phosphodiesterase class II)